MRTEKEIWEVVLEHQECFDCGLCIWIVNCLYDGAISTKELNILRGIISDEDPKSGIIYWIGKMGEIQPRIDWINNRINELI